MFGGKGGVGKTTCAGATALHYAKKGLDTLVISTDPTPSLSDIFEIDGKQKKPVQVLQNLHLAELGLDEVKDMWNRKFGRDVYEIFSALVAIEYEAFVDFITSILPGLREEFMVDYIKGLTRSGSYQKIVWDTAPLGQTFDLLRAPSMIGEHLKPAPKIYSKLLLGKRSKRPIMEIIKEWAELSNEDIAFLKRDVEYNLVVIPEALSVRQLEGIFAEFSQNRLPINRLIINNVIKTVDSGFLRTKQEQQEGYIKIIHDRSGGRPVVELPRFPYEIKGIGRLEEIMEALF
ncbi:MAG: ArsA family ATPase [Dehalococcoidia bacterium]|nr:ArsA family ATPase [Dehalococcoidia bacterium]